VFLIKGRGLKYESLVFPLEGVAEGSVREKAKALAVSYVRSLENVLRLYPHQWFNYFQFWDMKN